MDQKCPDPAYVRSTKSSCLRALANTFKNSPERSLSSPGRPTQRKNSACDSGQSNGSICSMPTQVQGTESRSMSVASLFEEPEKLKSKIPQPKRITPTPEVGKRFNSRAIQGKSRMRIIDQNRLRSVETQYQTLQGHQSDFLNALKLLGPQKSKMIGPYKLVPLVLDADNKLVLRKDNPLALPRELPIDRADCVQELKDRCQAAVDSGFVMLFDHVKPIQMAKDEFEASNEKEQLMFKLKDVLSRKMESIVDSIEQVCAKPVSQQYSPHRHLYQDAARLRREKQRMEARLLQINKNHTEKMNQLKVNFEGKLKAGEKKLQQQVDELKERLRSSEVQVNESTRQLEIQNASLTAKDSTIASIVPDMDQLMSLNTGLNQLVKKSDDALIWAQKDLQGTREQIVNVEVQLKKVQERVLELQNGSDQDFFVEKDQIIANLMAKVQHLMRIKDVHHGHEGNTEKLRAANDQLETKVSELQEKLMSTESQLEARGQRAEKLHAGMEHVRAELFRYGQLMVKMREQEIHDRNLISTYTDEINVLKQTKTDNREKIDQLYLESVGEDAQGNSVRCRGSSNQLDSKKKQLGHVLGQLNRLHEKIKGLEEFTKNMSELDACLSQIRDRQHEENIQIDLEISQLRDTML